MRIGWSALRLLWQPPGRRRIGLPTSGIETAVRFQPVSVLSPCPRSSAQRLRRVLTIFICADETTDLMTFGISPPPVSMAGFVLRTPRVCFLSTCFVSPHISPNSRECPSRYLAFGVRVRGRVSGVFCQVLPLSLSLVGAMEDRDREPPDPGRLGSFVTPIDNEPTTATVRGPGGLATY